MSLWTFELYFGTVDLGFSRTFVYEVKCLKVVSAWYWVYLQHRTYPYLALSFMRVYISILVLPPSHMRFHTIACCGCVFCCVDGLWLFWEILGVMFDFLGLILSVSYLFECLVLLLYLYVLIISIYGLPLSLRYVYALY